MFQKPDYIIILIAFQDRTPVLRCSNGATLHEFWRNGVNHMDVTALLGGSVRHWLRYHKFLPLVSPIFIYYKPFLN